MKRTDFYKFLAIVIVAIVLGCQLGSWFIDWINGLDVKQREAAATYYDVAIPMINDECVGTLYVSKRGVANLTCTDGRVYGNLTNYVIRDTVKIYNLEEYNAKRKKEKVREYPTL